MGKQNLTVLGATGSIGLSTLDVVARHPDRFSIYALAANQNVDKMLSLIEQFSPTVVVMQDADAATRLATMVAERGLVSQVESGLTSIEAVSSHPQVTTVVAAIVGAAGLRPTLSAVRAGKRVLLANKESLVMAGKLFMDAVAEFNAQLLPVDSEHNAIFQCMSGPFKGLENAGVEKILLTGSGGPFLNTPIEKLAHVTVDQAIAHPNWDMGQKISVDSATMMNKGLEFIEACWLFGATPEQIEVVIHPQSIIHSMVHYKDGSVIAQMGQPDMRTPIANCLGWPGRLEAGVAPLNFAQLSNLSFQQPCFDRFPCLRLAIDCMREGKSYPTALNAANEIAVDAFLARRIGFTQIAEVVQKVIESWQVSEPASLDEVIAADQLARQMANQCIDIRAA